MRKGADASKWVGEAEKQLRLLFTEATRLQARWRRSSNPQLCLARQAPPPTPSHTLALPRTAFDHLLRRDRRPRARALFETGLHPRVDRVDASRAHGRPRLARPGDPHRRDEPHRLPRCCASSPRPVRPRAPVRVAQRVGQIEILRIHTKSWAPPPAADLVTCRLSSRTHGYCGADLKALCAESALRALHDAYPQLLGADEKYVIDPSAVSIRREHFIHALSVLTPAAHRAFSVRSAPLPDHLRPMLQPALEDVLARLKEIFPPTAGGANAAAAAFRGACTLACRRRRRRRVPVCLPSPPPPHRPRRKRTGRLGAATLRALEHCTLYSLDLPLLVSDGSRSPQEACAHVFAEARRTLLPVVLLPSLDAWLLGAEPLLFSTLLLLLEQVPAAMPLLVLGTSGTAAIDLDDGARRRISSCFRGTGTSCARRRRPSAVPPSGVSAPTFALRRRRRSPPLRASHRRCCRGRRRRRRPRRRCRGAAGGARRRGMRAAPDADGAARDLHAAPDLTVASASGRA